MIRLLASCVIWSVLGACAWAPQFVRDVESADEGISVLQDAASAYETAVTETNPKVRPKVSITTVEPQFAAQPPITGPKFDLNVDDVAAATFFRSLVADTPFNMVVHPDVAGQVSLQLNQVTVPEVMNVMREMYGFDFSLQGSVFQVYPDAVRTQIFRLNYLNLARSGSSEVQVSAGKVSDVGGSSGDYQTNQGGQQQNNFNSNVNGQNGGTQVVGTIVNTQGEADLWAEVKKTLHQLIGDEEDAQVTVTPQVGLVVVRARPASLRAVQSFLEQVESSVSRQVILEAKIIEVTLNEGFQAGIDWHSFGDASQGFFRPQGVVQPDGSTVFVGGSEHSVAGSFLGSVENPLNPLNSAFAVQAAFGDFDGTLNLLSTQGTVQVLSSPRIATVNNQKAVIKVGSDEFFVTDISSNTVTAGSAININDSPELTPFFSGIALDVTPQISSDDEVILHVHPTVSEVSEQLKEIGGQIVPLAASTIRESDSIVKAQSGQIVVIGGLMQNSSRDNNASVPWLGRLPLVGHLFRHKNQTAVKSELVILIKPHVVNGGVQQSYLQSSADHARIIRDEFVR